MYTNENILTAIVHYPRYNKFFYFPLFIVQLNFGIHFHMMLCMHLLFILSDLSLKAIYSITFLFSVCFFNFLYFSLYFIFWGFPPWFSAYWDCALMFLHQTLILKKATDHNYTSYTNLQYNRSILYIPTTNLYTLFWGRVKNTHRVLQTARYTTMIISTCCITVMIL